MLCGLRLVCCKTCFNYFYFSIDPFIIDTCMCVTAIHTAAIEMLSGKEASRTSRKPEIVADAAYALMCKDSRSVTGNFFIDEDILKKEGITDFLQYACDPGIMFVLKILAILFKCTYEGHFLDYLYLQQT